MSISYIGIIGGQDAGKTALLASICNCFRSMGPMFSVSDARYHPFMNLHRLEHATAFRISGFTHNSDNTKMTDLGNDLNSRPIVWPPFSYDG